MYIINEDSSIYVTRGDIVAFSVTAEDNGEQYKFKPGDVVRIKVVGKKDCDNVVLQKDFPILTETDTVEILLTKEDTKIGGVISKPVDYWYEIELNPLTNPQTIVGYDDDGAKVFKLMPEGRDLTEDEVITPEDIPIVDKELDLTSTRPVENQVVAKSVAQLNGKIQSNIEATARIKSNLKGEIAVERARINNLTTLSNGSTTGDAELVDGRIDAQGIKWSNIGNGIRGFTSYLDSRLNDISAFKTEDVTITLASGYYSKEGVYSTHEIHKYTTVAVNGGEIYFVNTYYGYVIPDALVLDENNSLIGYYHINASAMEYSSINTPLVIPHGAKTLVVNAASDYVCEVRKAISADLKYDAIEQYTDNVIKSIAAEGGVCAEDNLCTEYVTSTLIKKNGKVTTVNNASYVTSEVAVIPGERLSIEYGYHYLNYGYVFLDDKNIVIRTSQLGDGTSTLKVVKENITVPFNATKLIIAHITTSGYPSAYKIEGIFGKGWNGKKWVCVGDSLTEVNSRTTKHYHDYIAEKTGLNVVNMGVSGSGYMMLNDSGKAFYQRITNVPTDADVVTIFGSGNDLSLTLGNVTDTGTNTICGCVNTTIDRLYSVLPTVQVGIVTPTPWESCPPTVTGNKMELYANAIVEICKRRGIPCLDLYHSSNLRPWDSKFKELAYSKDNGNGVHPDETGHKIIAPRFMAFLDSLLI